MKHAIKETLLRLRLLGLAALLYRSTNPRGFYHNIRYWLKGAPDSLPIPPLKLRALVWREYIDLSYFFQERKQIEYLLDTLAQKGASIEEFRAILDFGCGAGRALRQFPSLKRPLEKVKVYGTDINPRQIDWCRRNLPFAEFDINQAYPPLVYSSETFDFIYTFSVFTHLSESQQLAWMNELARVLRPGGYLLMTTCGQSYFETLTEKEKCEFRDGQLVIRHSELAGIPSSYAECIAFHPRSYVEKKLIAGFELIHFAPGVPSENGPKGELDCYFLSKHNF